MELVQSLAAAVLGNSFEKRRLSKSCYSCGTSLRIIFSKHFTFEITCIPMIEKEYDRGDHDAYSKKNKASARIGRSCVVTYKTSSKYFSFLRGCYQKIL